MLLNTRPARIGLRLRKPLGTIGTNDLNAKEQDMSDDSYYPPGYKTPKWALARIRESKANGGTELYLNGDRAHHHELSYLPPEVLELSKLAVLDLSENQLVELPEELGQLKHLSTTLPDKSPVPR